jgi:hypothetical protein
VVLGSSLYLLGPIIAFAVVGALGAILRWTFDSDATKQEEQIFPNPDDYGLLSVAAEVDAVTEARAMQHKLTVAGIRSTIAPSGNGRVRVLVFEAEIEAARRLVGGPTV